MEVAVVLPRGMVFSERGATSIDLVARDLALASRYRSTTQFYGADVANPFTDVNFIGLEAPSHKSLLSNIISKLEKSRPDIIIVHQHLESASKIARKFPDVPVLLHRHGLLRAKRGVLSKWIKKRRLAPLAGLVFVSDFVRQRFVETLGSDVPPSSIIHNGVDTGFWRPNRQKKQLLQFAGRARADKGLDILVDAFCSLRDPTWRLQLMLAVQTDAERSYADQLLARTATIPAVSIRENQTASEVRDGFAKSKIAVLPSIVEEGYPRSVAEALACGCLVIASNRGGVREVLQDDGILLDKPTVDQLLRALQESKLRLESFDEEEGRLTRLQHRLDIRRVSASYDALLTRTADEAVRRFSYQLGE